MYGFRRMHIPVAALSLSMAALLPSAVQAKPCRGVQRLQLRWTQKSATALVSLSANACDAPPLCAAGKTVSEGVTVTKPPFRITVSDAAGKMLSGEFDPADPACGARCAQLNRAGCSSGTDSYRLPGGFVRYVVTSPTQTTVALSKLRIPATQPPNFTAPLIVTVKDANGYAVEMELKNCRIRPSTENVTISCSN